MSKQYATHKRNLPGQVVPESQSAPATIGNQSMEALMSGQVAPSAQNMGHQVDLPAAIREKMETSFGADLSGVRLYESSAVAEAGAQAITRGSDIAFAPGKLDLASSGGQALLGHELSHVVSQARGQVSGAGFLNDHALEARADREGALAAAGESVYSGPVTPISASSVTAAAGPMQAKKEDEEKKITDEDRYNFAKNRLADMSKPKDVLYNQNQGKMTAGREAAIASGKEVASGTYTDEERQASKDQLKTMAYLFHNRGSEGTALLQEIYEDDLKSGSAPNPDDYILGNTMRSVMAFSQVSQNRAVNKNIVRSLQGAGAAGSSAVHKNLSDEKRAEISSAMAPLVQEIMDFDIGKLDLSDINSLLPHMDFITRIALSSQAFSDLAKGVRLGENDEVHKEVLDRVNFLNTAYKKLENFHTNRMLAGQSPDTLVSTEYTPTTSKEATPAGTVIADTNRTFGGQMAMIGGSNTFAAYREYQGSQKTVQDLKAVFDPLQTQLSKVRSNKGTRANPDYVYDVSQIPEELRMPEPEPKAKPKKKWWQFWK